jgi:hypothetical protein
MKGDTMKVATFARTRLAAGADKAARWKLIEAIAKDAESNGLLVTSGDSVLAAKRAIEEAGVELADRTVSDLVQVADFDAGSTERQRKVWRRYGWSVIRDVVHGDWTRDEALRFLDKARPVTQAQVRVAIRPDSRAPTHKDLNDIWHGLLSRLNGYFVDGAKAEERTETETPELDAHAHLAREMYRRMVEKGIDAEWRTLVESEESVDG